MRVLIEKVKSGKMTRVEANYAYEEKIAETKHRLDQKRAWNQSQQPIVLPLHEPAPSLIPLTVYQQPQPESRPQFQSYEMPQIGNNTTRTEGNTPIFRGF